MAKNTYKAFYNGKTGTIYAETRLAARDAAAKLWRVKPSKAYQISVVLHKKANGEVVSHSGAEF